MSIKLGDAIVYIGGDRGPLKKDLGAAEKDTRAWTVALGTAVGNLMGGVITKGAQLAGKAVVDLGRSLVDMTMDAASVEGVRNTFARLAESVGGDAVRALEDLRAATRGMVADSDLLSAGNKFLAMGLASTTEEAAQLAEMATQLGMAMGGDATSSMENFALLLANQSLPRLDSFGISSGKVRVRIEELMASTQGLTREQAFLQATMEEARKTMAKVGEQGDTAQGAMARIKATVENLRLEMGEQLLPIAAKVLGWIASLVQTYGPMVAEWLGGLVGHLEKVINVFDAVTKDGDTFNKMLGTLPEWLQPVILKVKEAYDWLNAKLVPIINTLYDAFAALIHGDVEGFWGRIAAVLLELGVPIEVIDKMRLYSEKAWAFIKEKLGPIFREVFNGLIKPGLEGLGMFIKDNLTPILIALGSVLLVSVVGPMLLAAAPVVALGAALIALGLIWKEYGDQVKVIVQQLAFIVMYYLNEAAQGVRKAFESVKAAVLSVFNWIKEAWEKIANFRLPDWMTRVFEGLGWGGTQASFGNQDNSQSITVYGGVQNYGYGSGQDGLQTLWELGQ